MFVKLFKTAEKHLSVYQGNYRKPLCRLIKIDTIHADQDSLN